MGGGEHSEMNSVPRRGLLWFVGFAVNGGYPTTEFASAPAANGSLHATCVDSASASLPVMYTSGEAKLTSSLLTEKHSSLSRSSPARTARGLSVQAGKTLIAGNATLSGAPLGPTCARSSGTRAVIGSTLSRSSSLAPDDSQAPQTSAGIQARSRCSGRCGCPLSDDAQQPI